MYLDSSHSIIRIEVYQLISRILCFELSVFFYTYPVLFYDLSANLLSGTFQIRERFAQCLTNHDTDLNLSHIQPDAVLGSIMPFEMLCQPPHFFRGNALYVDAGEHMLRLDFTWIILFSGIIFLIRKLGLRIHMTAFWGYILQIHAVDVRRNVQIALHPGRGNDEFYFLACTFLDGLHPLLDFKQPRPARDAVGFQRGRHSQTDRAVCAGFVRDNQVCGEGVEAHVYSFYAGVEAISGQRRCIDPWIPPP